MQVVDDIEGFIWDQGNLEKSYRKHGVSPKETEEAFFNFTLVSFDKKHSQTEPRYHLLGRTNIGKTLFIVFTTRNNHIRVISSRLANKKERSIYEEAIQKNT